KEDARDGLCGARGQGGATCGRCAVIEVFVHGALRNPLNDSLSRAHWTRKSKWSQEWKRRTWEALLCTVPPAERDRVLPTEPKLVRFLAQTGAAWDDDNLPAAIKPIRDALIGIIVHSDAPDS